MSFEKTGSVPQERNSAEQEVDELAARARVAHEQAEAAVQHSTALHSLTERDLAAMQKARAEVLAADRSLFNELNKAKFHLLWMAMSMVYPLHEVSKYAYEQFGDAYSLNNVSRAPKMKEKGKPDLVDLEKAKTDQSEQKRLASQVVSLLTQSDEEGNVPRSPLELRRRISYVTNTNPVTAAIVQTDRGLFLDHVHRGLADHARSLAAKGLMTEALRWQECTSGRIHKIDLFVAGHRPEAAINHFLEMIENPTIHSRAYLVGWLTDELGGHEGFMEEIAQAMDRRARLERHDRVRMSYLRGLLSQALQERERNIVSDAGLEPERTKDYTLQLERVHRAEEILNTGFVARLTLEK